MDSVAIYLSIYPITPKIRSFSPPGTVRFYFRPIRIEWKPVSDWLENYYGNNSNWCSRTAPGTLARKLIDSPTMTSITLAMKVGFYEVIHLLISTNHRWAFRKIDFLKNDFCSFLTIFEMWTVKKEDGAHLRLVEINK